MFRRFASSVLSSVPGFSGSRFRKLGGSVEYWEKRYREGGNSGDGSYGRLAEFKAQVLNDFVAAHQIESLIEFGCGDGNQLSLARYPRYLGLDVSPTVVRHCARRFQDDPAKSFLLYNPPCWHDRGGWIRADAALSLDVLYHLVEDEIYHLYMQHLFAAGRQFVIIYSSDHEEAPPASHVRPRQFTRDVAQWFPDFHLKHVVDPPWKTDFKNYSADRTPASFYFFEPSS